MNLLLQGKNVLISGSSRGIGLGIAEKFIGSGANVTINSRNEKELKLVSDKIGKCNYVSGDVCDFETAKIISSKADDIMGGIDILVCNVGSGSSVPPGQETLEEWQRIFSINLYSAVNLITASLSSIEKSRGSIICISSICGMETIPGAPVTYSVAKSALNSFVKSISVPYGERGIRINSIAPGNINFKGSVWEKKLENDPLSVKELLENQVPLKKFGSIDDIANLALWLASDLSKFVTGAIYAVDGGQTRSQ